MFDALSGVGRGADDAGVVFQLGRHAAHAVGRAGQREAAGNLPDALQEALAQRPGHVKSRDQLMDAAYGEHIYVDDRTIDSHIKRLRKKFKAVDNEFDMIETLYGVGYRFREV